MILLIIFSYNVGGVSAAPVDTIYINGSSGNDLWDGSSSKLISGTNGPKVTSIDPSNNSLNVQRNKIIKVTFNESIKFGKNSWIELHMNSNLGVPITSKIIGNCLLITPQYLQWNRASYTLILHTNSITDLNGNGLAAPFISQYKTAPLLLVSNSDPTKLGLVKDLNKTIKINFNRPIRLMDHSEIEFKTYNGTPIQFISNISGSTIYIKPNKPLTKNTTYLLILHNKSVKDFVGSFLAIEYRLVFNTIN